MSYGDSLDKDRAYASQCNIRVRWYCSVCVLQNKLKKHCKIYKTPASWWWHLKHDHGKFVNRKFSFDDLRVVSNYLVKALEWGIIPESGIDEFIDVPPATTSSSILMDGLPPRTDRLEKLVKIANLLKLQSEHYPKFKPKFLSFLAEQILGLTDLRTKKKYIDCINHIQPSILSSAFLGKLVN